MNLTFKMAAEADYPVLVEFWNQHAGWDVISREIWEERFISTPLGASQIAMASLDGELCGQFIFVPFQLKAGDQIYQAYRPFAPVIASRIRLNKQGILGPILLNMYNQSIQYLTEKKVDLIYMIPDPRWIRLFSKDPRFHLLRFPLYSQPLDGLKTKPLPKGWTTEKILPTDQRIDAVWEQMTRHCENTLVRDLPYFRWKAAIHRYELFLLSHEDRPVGLYSLMNKNNDAMCLIGEVLSTDRSHHLQATLLSALNEAANRKKTNEQIQKTAVLATDWMTPLLKELNFKEENYTFSLVLHPLNEALRSQLLKKETWYLSAGD